jgi:hypothetical protein
MKFRTVTPQGGKNSAGNQVPDAVVGELGAGKRPPAVVTMNECSSSSIVSEALRDGSG